MPRLHFLISASVIACGCPGLALAQDASDGDTDIVVTGSKLGEAPQRAARSLQVLESEDLEARGIRDLASLTKVVPGLTFTQSTYGVPVYSIRGIGYFDNSLAAPPAVSVYVDEAPLPYAALAIGASLDVSRVDVAKGPQGTLFGQNSTGGAINYVSAKPTRQFAAGIETGVASYGLVSSDGYVSGPVARNLGMRLALRYDRGGDWQRSDTSGRTRGGKDLLIGRLLTEWKPADNLAVLINLNGWRDRSDTMAGQLVTLRSPSPPLPAAAQAHPVGIRGNRTADWSRDQRFARDAEYYQASIRAVYDISDVTLTSITSWQRHTRNDTADSDGTQFELLHSRTPGRLSVFSQELGATTQLGALKVMAGGNYQREHIRDELALTIGDSSFPFDAITTKTTHDNRSWALFSNADLALTSSLTVEAGGRYTDERRGFSGCSYDGGDGSLAAFVGRVATNLSGTTVVIPAGGCVSLSDKLLPAVYEAVLRDRNWSWWGGVKWSASRSLLIYGNVSKGQKSGAFPTVAATAVSQFAPVEPESVLAYEAGAKFTGLDGRLRLSAAGYYYDYRKKQIRGKTVDPRIGPLGALVNIPRSHVVGGEVSVDFTAFEGLDLRAGASLSHSRIEAPFLAYDAYGRLRDLSGERFPLTPAWQLVGDAGYRWRVGEGVEAFVGANVKYQSAADADLGEIEALALDPYALVDLRAGLRIGERWSAQAFVSNVGNQRYATFVSTVSPDVNVRFTGAPRIVGLRFGLNL